ncbi:MULTISPECIES: hypothetical protein [unclassified Streptomyces]|uniref:hypothetical protein n=1 Tax=unclassified Streptomyces TaxID=2593676 RepID=UPI000DD7D862|nr:MULTISPECIES: hypothetical protein [unclassified Streptomyces]QZZ29088.1 hypothetical protein A7X85_25065 [Streptomyces sp. ST1015]
MESNDDYRVVIGEECFDWRELTDTDRRDALDALSDVLQPLVDGRRVALMDAAYDAKCLPSNTLADALYSPNCELPPDERRLLQRLLDKCRSVDVTDTDLPSPVRITDAPWIEPSWGTAHALSRATTGRAMSCLLPPSHGWPSGWHTVERNTDGARDEVRLHVLTVPEDTLTFWRGVYDHERVPADHFFTLTADAFPRLLFADSLRLNHFKGTYSEVLPWLLKLLAALNDHFGRTLTECGGDQNQVKDRFAALGLDISPESSNTKKNAKAWEQRNVMYQKATYRCEWHGKRLWDRDRVHFSLPLAGHNGRVLVGIFTNHLDT